MARKVSGPQRVWIGRAFSASTAAPYSMQPFSARTAGALGRNACRIASRLPGLAGMTAMTWGLSAPLVPFSPPPRVVGHQAPPLAAPLFRASGGALDLKDEGG